MTEGRRLLLALARTRTTIRYVAARCQVSPAAVHHWVSGRTRPNPQARETLEKCYSIPAASWDTYLIRSM